MGFFRSRKSFTVLLIRPSKYDDEGYVIRYFKGVLPSNTLNALSALAREAFESGRFGPDVNTRLAILDDVVQDINVPRLARKYLGPGRRAVVCFAGVQSNQFPRASDLAARFKKAGFEVMIGGFHVSGAVALSPTMPPECQALIDQGVTLVKGEVEEGVFGDLLEDAWRGRLKPFYDIVEKPSLEKAPIPVVDPRYQRRFLFPRMGTIDASRGCPFDCSFCTIINVQGRKMRCRTPQAIARQVEINYERYKVDYYFFTDDNFARNKNRDAILDALIELRETKKILLEFMMQVDTKAWKIPGFVERAARAGCSQVFIGVESLNTANLEAVDKKQNIVDDFPGMIRAWHEAGVACHATLMVGFPFDTPESMARDVERLKAMGPDQCSFFMLTPLPGSADHARFVSEGAWMDPDYNNYDSCHETLDLQNFQKGEWYKAYMDAWKSFYSFENMRDILLRCNAHTYWGILKNFMWYRNAIHEQIHPMVAGFWRLKPRADRRPGYAVEGRLRHLMRRARESWQTLKIWKSLFLELEELWLQTRLRPETAPGYLANLREQWGENVSHWGEALRARAEGARRFVGEKSAHAREWLSDSATGVQQSLGERSATAREWLSESATGVQQSLGETGAHAREWLSESATGVRRALSEKGADAREWLSDSAAGVQQSLGETGAHAREWLSEKGSAAASGVRDGVDYLQASRDRLRRGTLVSLVERLLVKWNNWGQRRFIDSRKPLDAYWRLLRGWARKGHVLRLSFEAPRIGVRFLRDARLTATFLVYFLRELTCD